jgi:hypothetical protein
MGSVISLQGPRDVRNRIVRLSIGLLALVLMSVVVWRVLPMHSLDLDAEARAFAEAFVRGDCKALWRYASEEERSRLTPEVVERLYDVLVRERLGGVRLYTGPVSNAPEGFGYRNSVFSAVTPQPRDYHRYAVILQSGDGSVIRAHLRLRLRGRRVETSLSQFFFEVARGYVSAQIPWNDRKTSRTVVALEKFGEVFRSCGLSGLYEYWSKEWFSWEEWEAFARSGRMRTTGTGFD